MGLLGICTAPPAGAPANPWACWVFVPRPQLAPTPRRRSLVVARAHPTRWRPYYTNPWACWVFVPRPQLAPLLY